MACEYTAETRKIAKINRKGARGEKNQLSEITAFNAGLQVGFIRNV
jgi:hypothetical protein